jgi:hypothetical protein
MSERHSVAGMFSEGIRDVSILLLVFLPLDYAAQGTPLSTNEFCFTVYRGFRIRCVPRTNPEGTMNLLISSVTFVAVLSGLGLFFALRERSASITESKNQEHRHVPPPARPVEIVIEVPAAQLKIEGQDQRADVSHQGVPLEPGR